MIKSYITDPKSKVTASVIDGIEVPALAVATRDLKVFNNKSLMFINETYGSNMNQNATFGGTPILVYDENAGTPTEWSTSALSGTWTFNSATQHYNGSVSIAQITTNPGNNNVTMVLSKGSNQDLTGYTAITLWIYLTAAGTGAINFGGYAAGILVGNLVNIKTYINTGNLNMWQKATISLTVLNLTNKIVDSFRVTKVTRETAFYLDYIRIQETGGPIPYSIQPTIGTWLYIKKIRWAFVDAYSSALVNNSMPLIPYNSFLGVSKLANGISAARKSNGEIQYTAIFQQMLDLMTSATANIVNYGSDGTNTWVILESELATPIILKSEYQDSLTYSVNDDMTGLLEFKMSAACYEEVRVHSVVCNK